MIITIMGLPGQHTSMWREVCVDILRRLGNQCDAAELVATRSDDDPSRWELDSLGLLAYTALGVKTGVLVVVARTPERSFANAVLQAKRPFLLCLEDPRDSAAYLVESGLEAASALRLTCQSCACLYGLATSGGAVVLRESASTNPNATVITNVLSVLGISPDAETMKVARECIELHSSHLSRSSSATQSEEALSARAALTGYAAAFGGGNLGPIVVTRELFYVTDPLGNVAERLIDLTGRARMLTFGPYIAVPAGGWILQLVLAFSAEIEGVEFSIEVVSEQKGISQQLANSRFTVTSGRNLIRLSFKQDHPEALLQFRLHVHQAIFDGQVSIGYAELRKSDEAEFGHLADSIRWNEGDFSSLASIRG